MQMDTCKYAVKLEKKVYLIVGSLAFYYRKCKTLGD